MPTKKKKKSVSKRSTKQALTPLYNVPASVAQYGNRPPPLNTYEYAETDYIAVTRPPYTLYDDRSEAAGAHSGTAFFSGSPVPIDGVLNTVTVSATVVGTSSSPGYAGIRISRDGAVIFRFFVPVSSNSAQSITTQPNIVLKANDTVQFDRDINLAVGANITYYATLTIQPYK